MQLPSQDLISEANISVIISLVMSRKERNLGVLGGQITHLGKFRGFGRKSYSFWKIPRFVAQNLLEIYIFFVCFWFSSILRDKIMTNILGF